MASLTEGLMLRRLAEDCADRGVAAGVDDDLAARLKDLLVSPEVVAVVANRLDGDEVRSQRWLRAVDEAVCSREDEDAFLVAALAALGDALIEAASAQPTGTFEALAHA